MASHEVIFYLGPPGTYSHEAASTIATTRQSSGLASTFELRPSDNITACLADAKAHSAFALVPLENSTYGPVNETINALVGIGKEASVVGEVVRPVRHALLASRDTERRLDELYAAEQSEESGRESRLRFLEVVYSHEQVSSLARLAGHACV